MDAVEHSLYHAAGKKRTIGVCCSNKSWVGSGTPLLLRAKIRRSDLDDYRAPRENRMPPPSLGLRLDNPMKSNGEGFWGMELWIIRLSCILIPSMPFELYS